MQFVATAQESYRQMIKAQLAPGLRSLGFTGSGRTYDLGWAEHWAMLGLQASQWSDREELTFDNQSRSSFPEKSGNSNGRSARF